MSRTMSLPWPVILTGAMEVPTQSVPMWVIPAGVLMSAVDRFWSMAEDHSL